LASTSTTWREALTIDAPARRDGRRFYHPELDILRFLAFFLVFLHHALPHDPAFWTRFVPVGVARVVAGIGAMGAFGVDVFFALSAYLITELLLREKALIGDLDLKSFYVRRVLRIWPLYFFFLALAGALTFVVPGQKIGWQASLAFLFLSGNWWIVLRGFPSSVIFPLWSVSIEEQFYLFWPPLVRRLRATHMGVLACAMLAIAWVTRWYVVTHGAAETLVWCNTLARLDPIAAGILVAILLRGETPEFSIWMRTAMMAFGMSCLALAGNYWSIKADPLTIARVLAGYPAVAIGAAALLVGVLTELRVESPGSKTKAAKSALVYLGRISYGLYVYHVLGLMVSDFMVPHAEAGGGRYLLRAVIAFSLTVAFAAASFRRLETPFLALKQRFTHVLSRPGG
jgi:peptidoglycan/LPS O-acetylase OafA/YrhL